MCRPAGSGSATLAEAQIPNSRSPRADSRFGRESGRESPIPDSAKIGNQGIPDSAENGNRGPDGRGPGIRASAPSGPASEAVGSRRSARVARTWGPRGPAVGRVGALLSLRVRIFASAQGLQTQGHSQAPLRAPYSPERRC
jgi:hypothetical protein